jgi:RyR domain
MSVVTAIARTCHEVNRAYCASQGDHSQPAWADAPEWQRQSAVTGVLYAMGHPDARAADSHESLLAQKGRDGWTYGPVKDPEAKTHPCFVPYDELPPAQKAKDYIFLAIVREMTAPNPERSHEQSQG